MEEPETDLATDAEHLREYVVFMDEHVRPLLSQAVKAALRARSEDALRFVIRFLDDANVQMRTLRCTDRMLRSCKVSADRPILSPNPNPNPSPNPTVSNRTGGSLDALQPSRSSPGGGLVWVWVWVWVVSQLLATEREGIFDEVTAMPAPEQLTPRTTTPRTPGRTKVSRSAYS